MNNHSFHRKNAKRGTYLFYPYPLDSCIVNEVLMAAPVNTGLVNIRYGMYRYRLCTWGLFPTSCSSSFFLVFAVFDVNLYHLGPITSSTLSQNKRNNYSIFFEYCSTDTIPKSELHKSPIPIQVPPNNHLIMTPIPNTVRYSS